MAERASPDAAERIDTDRDNERARLDIVLRQLPIGVVIAEAPTGRLILGNERVKQIWRRTFHPLDNVDEYVLYRGFHPDGRPLESHEWPLSRALNTGEEVRGEEIDILRGDGTRGTIRVSAAPIRDHDGAIEAAVVTFDDITGQRRIEESLRFLTEASSLLSASLDYTTTLTNVVDLIVPRLADWCVVDVVDADGAIRRLAMKHANPERAHLLQRLEEMFPHTSDAPTGPANVLRSGVSEFYPEIPIASIEASARDAAHLDLMLELNMRSYMCVPLSARGRIFGALSFLFAESDRRYTAADLILAEELGRRAAIAVDNAMLFEAERMSRGHAEAAQRRLAFLADAVAILTESLDYDTVMSRLADLSVPLLGDVCLIDTIATDGTISRAAIAHADPAHIPALREMTDSYPDLLQSSQIVRQVIETQEPVTIPDIPAAAIIAAVPSEDLRERAGLLNLRSAMIMPIVARGATIGVLSFISSKANRYEREEMDLARELAARAAIGIDNARLYRESQIAREETQRTAERLTILAEASRAFAMARPESPAILDAVAREVALRIGDLCIIRLLSEDGQYLEPAAVHSPNPHELETTRAALAANPHHVSEGVNGQVIATGHSIMFRQTSVEELTGIVKHEYQEHMEEFRTTSLLVVPLVLRGRVIGTMGVSRTRPNAPYSADDQALIEDLAERAALAIESARLIEDARAAETRYHSLFESVADAIFVADADGRYLDVNPAAVRLLGYSRDELLTMRVSDIVSEDAGWTDAEYARYRERSIWHGELQLRRKDGALVPVEATATVGHLPSGDVYLSSIRDISERRAAELLQRDFIAMVTHDLKAPLTSIRGFAQLMQRRGTYSERGAEAIVAQTQQLERLITDLLDAARLEAGHTDLRRTRMELLDLIDSIAESVQASSTMHRISVTASASSIWGSWDRDRVAQILQNLLSNAVKYSPAGGDVLVTVAATDSVVTVAIQDNGLGIPESELPNIFERFYRVDAAGHAQGLGLGLYITRSLVEAHGGEIGVDSVAGQGSTFWFRLPLEAAGVPGPIGTLGSAGDTRR